MAVFKCKMCGGQLDVTAGSSVAVCPYCDTQQTLPKLDDEKRANRYDRANHFRRNNEFDKAMAIYEQILTEDTGDAEAYWSLVLCRYGIEYVEDPTTHKRIPTVNRAQFTSIFDDDNYRSALKHADEAQRALYEAEAKAINEIQKGILAISQKEEPFDVFICYKETDNDGNRTHDSVLAQDLYFQLKQEGFKVFFSRITLEDKLGSAYEPYIFAALNSAKVMVVLGTKQEYFNAVWVKNEWSRYLALIKGGAKKMLIPAYKDMDPYDLPEEFSHLQAQDMSKLGFMQDLVRGIRKIAKEDEPQPTVIKETVVAGSTNIEPLLKRAFLFVEDGDFDTADEYCERVLDVDPENAQAYLCKLLIELRVRKQEQLAEYKEPFSGSSNYQKVLRFGDDALINDLQAAAKNVELSLAYKKATAVMNNANTEGRYKEAAGLFTDLVGFRDAAELQKSCLEKAEACRKNAIYTAAKAQMAFDSLAGYETAIGKFKTISGWRDADVLLQTCHQRIDEIHAAERQRQMEREERQAAERLAAARRARKRKITTTALVCVLLAIVVATPFLLPYIRYYGAAIMVSMEEYGPAYDLYVKLGDFMEAPAKAAETKEQAKAYKLENCQIGDLLIFGSYEQDDNPENGAEDIIWRVVDMAGNKALVVSEYCLDAQPYHVAAAGTPVMWDYATIRTWLNSDFLDEAFTAQEDNIIRNQLIPADSNPAHNTLVGTGTRDRVFLLSVYEAQGYFASDEDRATAATAYAKGLGLSYLKKNDRCGWWLRTPGAEQHMAVCVSNTGELILDGEDATSVYGVRPAMWISVG